MYTLSDWDITGARTTDILPEKKIKIIAYNDHCKRK